MPMRCDMKTIVCYGDSNTWGYIPGSAEERYPYDIRWTGVLQRLLGAEYHVIEEGLNGRTTCFEDPTWPDRNGFASLPVILESHFPMDLILIMLGSNDAKHIFPGKPYACGRALELYVRQIRGSGYGPDKKDPEILVVSPVLVRQCVTSDSFDPVMSVRFTQELGNVYRKYADALHVHFLDAAAIAQADDADGLHMNAQGHAAFARALQEKILSILEA